MGLAGDKVKDLLFRHPLAQNCEYLEPPKLNEEVKVLLDEGAKGRDSRIAYFQQRP